MTLLLSGFVAGLYVYIRRNRYGTLLHCICFSSIVKEVVFICLLKNTEHGSQCIE